MYITSIFLLTYLLTDVTKHDCVCIVVRVCVCVCVYIYIYINICIWYMVYYMKC